MSPGIDNLIVTLGIGNETHGVVSCNLLYLVMATLYNLCLLLGDDDVVKVKGETALVGHLVAKILDAVKEGAGAVHAD